MTVVVPDLAELFEEAYERAGLIMRSGYDLKTARAEFEYPNSRVAEPWVKPVHN
jgi:hypothetical protein